MKTFRGFIVDPVFDNVYDRVAAGTGGVYDDLAALPLGEWETYFGDTDIAEFL